MRIESEILKKGRWWLPEKPENQIEGTLHIQDGVEIDLRLSGVFNNPIEEVSEGGSHEFGNRVRKIERIEGVIESGDFVVLERCYEAQVKFGFPHGFDESTVRASFAYIGPRANQIGESKFSKAIFSIDGLDEWLNITGIELSYEKGEWEKGKSYRGAIKYEILDAIPYEINDFIKLSFNFGLTLNPTPILNKGAKKAEVEQNTNIEIEFKDEIEIGEILKLIQKILNFFSFSVAKEVFLKSFRVEVKEEETNNIIDAYFRSRSPKDKFPELRFYEMPFSFQTISDEFPQLLNNWLINSDTLAPTFNLYFSVLRHNPTLETRFLLLAHAIESFHRRECTETFFSEEDFANLSERLRKSVIDNAAFTEWVENRLRYGNELSLRNRLRQLLEPFEDLFGTSSQRRTFISKFVNTRNYLTHYDKRLEEAACRGLDLLTLSNNVEALIQLHFLKMIEFPKDKLDEIISRGIRGKIEDIATFS